MIHELFQGAPIDIHGGGMDLVFPHHDNEIAQSESCNHQELAKTWMHVAFINVDNAKMSKSLNNGVTITQLFEKIDPMVFRLYVLNSHYRSPLHFSWSALESFERMYKKLCGIFSKTSDQDLSSHQPTDLLERLYEIVCKDLNTAQCLGLLFENAHIIKKNLHLQQEVKSFLTLVLGITIKIFDDVEVEQEEYSHYIKELIGKRNEARRRKDFALADAIKQELLSYDIVLKDEKI